MLPSDMELMRKMYLKTRNVYLFSVICFNCLILRTHAFPYGQGNDSEQNERSDILAGEKRSVEGFYTSLPSTVSLQTLTNASIMMCADAMAQPYARMVQLSDEQMRGILQDKGGNYVRDYMAATQEEALENFHNMLILTKPISANGSITSFSVMDNLVTKQMVIDDLNKLAAFLMGNHSTTNKNESHPVDTDNALGSEFNTKVTLSTNGTLTSKQIYSKSNSSVTTPTPAKMHFSTTSLNNIVDTPDALSTTSSVSEKYTPNIESTTQASVTESPTHSTGIETSTVSLLSSGTEQTTLDAINGSSLLFPDATTQSYSASSSNQAAPSTHNSDAKTLTTYSPRTLTPKSSGGNPSTMETKTTTEDPRILNGIEQLQHYVQGTGSLSNISNLGKRELDSIWRNANTTLHPTTLLGLAAGSRRIKRHADGSYSEQEYCQNKGALTEDHKFVHLCSICATTTKLPGDMFPRYINEAVCKTGDTDCFTIGGTSHGQCKQTRFSLNMLRKKSGHCNMLIHGGETLVFENWELVPQLINVSCECTINKLSVFSKYAGHNVPLG